MTNRTKELKVFSIFAHKDETYDYRTEEREGSQFIAKVNLSEEQLINLLFENGDYNSFDDVIIICNGYVIQGSCDYGVIDNTTEQEAYSDYLKEYYNTIIRSKVGELILAENERKRLENEEKTKKLTEELRLVIERTRQVNEENQYKQYLLLKEKYEHT